VPLGQHLREGQPFPRPPISPSLILDMTMIMVICYVEGLLLAALIMVRSKGFFLHWLGEREGDEGEEEEEGQEKD